MKPTVEERLARVGPTLDAATDARAAADRLGETAGSAPAAPSRRWLTAVAAAVAVLIVVGVGALAVRRPGSVTHPATSATARVSAAVDSTRSVAAMAVDVHGSWSFAPDGADGIWAYGAPDRWEQMAQSDAPRLERTPPGGVSVRLYVGDKSWTAGDRGWQAEVPVSAIAPDPRRMLDDLAATDCAVEDDGQLVAWNSGRGVCPAADAGVPGDLPVGAWLWVLVLDGDGRLREVRTAVVSDHAFGDGVDLEGQGDPLVRAGALLGGSARFWYDHVAEVSGEPAE